MALEKNDFINIDSTEEELKALPLWMKNILYMDFVDVGVPYKEMYNNNTSGRLFSQHSIRKISLITDYNVISKLLCDE